MDPFTYAADLLDPPEHPHARDVPRWAEERLDASLTEAQVEIAQSVVANRATAVKSGHGIGKSWDASAIAAHWIDTHPPGEAFVVTTAPSWPQVKAVLWRELGRNHRRGKLPGRLTESCEWKIDMGSGPSEVVAMGRKPADYDPAGFQGIHARYVLVVIDEAGGVPRAIFEGAESLLTNEDARILAIGNPDDPASYFAEVCRPGSGWNVIRCDTLRSPNFTKEEVARFPRVQRLMIREGIKPSKEKVPDRVRPMLVSPMWVDERITRWGVDSPIFTSKVRGEFPTVTVDTLIEPRWVLAAQERSLTPDHHDPRLGVDVARYGPDHTILALRLGGVVRVVADVAKGPTTEVAGLVQTIGGVQALPCIANVDDAGVGGGVTDILVEEGYPVLPLVAAGSATEKLPNGRPRFVNARSEWWWTLREALAGESGTGADGWLDLDPDDDELAAQLLGPRYHYNRHGQIEVESKDDSKKRGLPSPDRADAVTYTLVTHKDDGVVMPGRMIMQNILEEVW